MNFIYIHTSDSASIFRSSIEYQNMSKNTTLFKSKLHISTIAK
jgi:hypothetical protein